MTWLKLTKEALCLMEGSDCIDKVATRKESGTVNLSVPLNWFRNLAAPEEMIVSLGGDTPSPVVSIATPKWASFYAGLDDPSGSQIPRKGLGNPTLKTTLGVDEEPLGEVVKFEGLDFVRGKVSWFGGKKDDFVDVKKTGALTGEELRSLPENDYYCSMRWSFSPSGENFWVDRRLLVINPMNQKAVIVRAIDWGPNTSTKRILDLSPQALKDLGVETDDDLLCSFAKPDGHPVGLI
jgi:hypothetical protein